MIDEPCASMHLLIQADHDGELNAAEAAEMVGRVLGAFPPREGAEVTFEGIPYLFTQEEKIVALNSCGRTGLSFTDAPILSVSP